jgi:RNA methyltransferase, TrmH family
MRSFVNNDKKSCSGMLSNNQSKLLLALQVKKYRQKYRKFIVEGEKMVAELLRQPTFTIDAIFGLKGWATENATLLAPFSDIFQELTEQELKKVSSLATPNKVMALVDMPAEHSFSVPAQPSFCFYLDGIRDPGNFGAILRVADWFGIPWVFCSSDSADLFNAKTVQASMGAVFRIHSKEIELTDLLLQMPDMPVLGAVMDGTNVFQADLPNHGLLVIGNEGAGIRPEAERLLTHRITIPRDPNGQAESLNAALAAGIIAAVIKNR